MTGRAHGAFPGARIATTTLAGSSILAGFPASLPACALIPGSRSRHRVLHNGTGFTAEVARELAVTACRLAEPALPTVAVPAPAPVSTGRCWGSTRGPRRRGAESAVASGGAGLPHSRDSLLAATLEPTSDTDVFVAGPGSDLAWENVIFRRRNDGHVTSVLLVQATYLRQDHDSRTGRSDQPLCAAHYRSGLVRIRGTIRSLMVGGGCHVACDRVLRPGCGICLLADSIWRGHRPGADQGKCLQIAGVLSAV